MTHDDGDSNSHMSDVPLQLPANSNLSSNSAVVTFSQAEGDLVRNVPSLHPIPRQTGVNLWQLQYPSTYPQGLSAVLGHQETVQQVTQRAREALNIQRETPRRALLHQQGHFLAAAHQYEAAAKQNLVSALARNNEAHNHNVQMRDFRKDRANCYLFF